MEMVNVQAQLVGGTWRTYTTTMNDSQYYSVAMRNLSNANPDKRIRVVDMAGRVIDIL